MKKTTYPGSTYVDSCSACKDIVLTAMTQIIFFYHLNLEVAVQGNDTLLFNATRWQHFLP